MKMRLPQYTTKDYLVLGLTILPITLIINSLIFGGAYYSDWKNFLFCTVLTAIAFAIDFILCGAIAVLMLKRFPDEKQVEKRLTFMIVSFITITGLFLFALFKGYEFFPFLHYSFNDEGFIWAYMGMGIINIFFTFLHESIARYEKWKTNLLETEALRKVYRQTRLQGLKSQVNPHFLFNSLNSLSGLIHEDGERGEKFLDEMSKVYRYMLHNDEETLVKLEKELKFLESYIHILEVRHSEGLKFTVLVTEDDKEKWLPPLTLQTIIENSLAEFSVCRDCPLEIVINSDEEGYIKISNNIVQRRMSDQPQEDAPDLGNIIKKYKLLNQPDVIIEEEEMVRMIKIPLIAKNEEELV